MNTREFNIDCMEYRKSTHLASVDVDAIIAEKGKCELTIKLAFYDRGVDVSGNKTDGYFLQFEEAGFKDMVVNSGNRKKIANIVRELKQCSPVESRNLTNWVGLKISLKVDPNIKMMGQIVGGIVIDTTFKAPAQVVDYSAQEKQLRDCKTLAELQAVYTTAGFPQTALVSVKDEMKTKLNTDVQTN